MAKTLHVDTTRLADLERQVRHHADRLDSLRRTLRAAVLPVINHPQTPLRASIHAGFDESSVQIGARIDSLGSVARQLRAFVRRLNDLESKRVRVQGELLAAAYMGGVDASKAGDFVDAVNQMDDREIRVLNDLLDAGLSAGQLAEVLKGGHVVLPGTELYDKWGKLGAHVRTSSHYPSVDKDQFRDKSISGGAVTKEILFGQVDGFTWVQLENAGLGGLKATATHTLDYIDYAIVNSGNENSGPWGDSAHTEHHNPIHLGGACRYPTSIPLSRADLIQPQVDKIGGWLEHEAEDVWSETVTPGIAATEREVRNVRHWVDRLRPEIAAGVLLKTLGSTAWSAMHYPGFRAMARSGVTFESEVVYVATTLADGRPGPSVAQVYPGAFRASAEPGPISAFTWLGLLTAPITVPHNIWTLVHPTGDTRWDRAMDRVGATGGLAATTSSAARVAVGRVGGAAAAEGLAGTAAVAAPITVAASGAWGGWQIGSWYMKNTTEADRDHWWNVLHYAEVDGQLAGEAWYAHFDWP